MSKIKFFIIALVLLLSACNDKDEITELDNPDMVAIAFFNALYNEKDINKAASVCSPKMARIILHYRSHQAVARHLFNMSYDEVVIEPESKGVKVREQFKDQAKITVYFTGTYNKSIHKNVKRVSLVHLDGKWVIDAILKDPF